MGASGVRSEPPTDQQTSTLGLTLEFLSYKILDNFMRTSFVFRENMFLISRNFVFRETDFSMQ